LTGSCSEKFAIRPARSQPGLGGEDYPPIGSRRHKS
jgi:hypothetical protein